MSKLRMSDTDFFWGSSWRRVNNSSKKNCLSCHPNQCGLRCVALNDEFQWNIWQTYHIEGNDAIPHNRVMFGSDNFEFSICQTDKNHNWENGTLAYRK